jgi:hypothetical protein
MSTVTCSGSCPCPSTAAGASGSITDGPGNYDDSATCAWVISSQGGSIGISFPSFSTEQGYDFVHIHSCESSTDAMSCESSIELARLSGSSTEDVTGTWTSTTGHLRITFTSDSDVNRDGFTGEWFLGQGCSSCPAGKAHINGCAPDLVHCPSLQHE